MVYSGLLGGGIYLSGRKPRGSARYIRIYLSIIQPTATAAAYFTKDLEKLRLNKQWLHGGGRSDGDRRQRALFAARIYAAVQGV